VQLNAIAFHDFSIYVAVITGMHILGWNQASNPEAEMMQFRRGRYREGGGRLYLILHPDLATICTQHKTA